MLNLMTLTRNTVLGAAAAATLTLGGAAQATTLAEWTFEVSIPTTAGPHAAEGGIFAVNSQASTTAAGTVTNPVGNGSAESFSVTDWSLGQYFQFTTSTLGYQDIKVSWDQTGSNTGPRDWKVAYSVNGVDFFDIPANATYSITNDGWSSVEANYRPASTRDRDLSTVSALNDQAQITLRFIVDSSTSINGGATASGGSGRVDDVIITGTVIPEPASLALLGLGGLMMLGRRRQA